MRRCAVVPGILLLMLVVACAQTPETEVAETATTPATAYDAEEAAEQPQFPPDGSMPLSELVALLEAADHGAIAEIEFEDGAWEVEAVKDGAPGEFRVDPATGAPIEGGTEEQPAGEDDDDGEEAEETVQLPPAGSKALSEILAMLESAGHGPIAEIEFEQGFWAVESMKDGSATRTRIDPMTGEALEPAGDVSSG